MSQSSLVRVSRWVLPLGAFSLLIGMSVLGNQGCANKTPSAAAFVATSTPTLPSYVIDNLEDGDTYLNPAMSGVTRSGVPTGFWIASTFGDSSNVINGTPGAAFIFGGGVGAAGTSSAIHIFGKLKDNGDGQYPSFQLEARLKGGTVFDASQYGYSGVRFYLKTGAGDNCPYRRFKVGVGATTPSSGGGYATSANAYSHFSVVLQTTSGSWAFVSEVFSTLHREFGAAISPSDLSGKNLQELLLVEWQFGRNNVAGSSDVDYWVDEVEFF